MVIRVKGMTLTKLALDAGLPEGTCRVALIRPHTEGDRVIASFLKVPLCELWPSRYDGDGNSIRHERDNTSSNRDGTHRLIVGAA
ncbi:MAG: helix-turn-helix domain-containing protein [Brevundimonas sp.]|nr:helix-turn-helix domain-containing protein [Brevundimonas sp.]